MEADGSRRCSGADEDNEAASVEMVLRKEERFVVSVAAVVSGDNLRGARNGELDFRGSVGHADAGIVYSDCDDGNYIAGGWRECCVLWRENYAGWLSCGAELVLSNLFALDIGHGTQGTRSIRHIPLERAGVRVERLTS
jgi:hypothetical protein